ncbi:MAG: hypothetical protein JRD93_22260 [Deltaproteobacteria bacterium]|nr:hypothetical protein [Deltaproteobacteria bacterium]
MSILKIFMQKKSWTAITRAGQSVIILGKEEVLRTSISRVIERKSGLHDSLWG